MKTKKHIVGYIDVNTLYPSIYHNGKLFSKLDYNTLMKSEVEIFIEAVCRASVKDFDHEAVNGITREMIKTAVGVGMNYALCHPIDDKEKVIIDITEMLSDAFNTTESKLLRMLLSFSIVGIDYIDEIGKVNAINTEAE